MRAAAILGLGCSERDLKPFQEQSSVAWSLGLPASASQADAVLIFGGDGTIHRHLAQLVELGLPVLVVPRGSGNDFARALNLRRVRDSLAAWRRFVSTQDNVRAIDLGLIAPMALPTENSKYFCCVGGVGLDGEVARRANQLPRWLRGHGGYALSFPQALVRFAPFPMKILVPDNKQPDVFVTRSAKLTILAAFANASTYGGGMKIAPNAQLDDGLLDVCILNDIDKFKLFCLFPTIYFGRHLSMPEIEYFQADRLRIETEQPLDVYADGEYVCRTPVEVTVVRKVLRIVAP